MIACLHHRPAAQPETMTGMPRLQQSSERHVATSHLRWLVVVLSFTCTNAVAKPTVESAMTIVPYQQKDADFDRPDAETVRRCTIDNERFDGAPALVVRDPNGVILRAFADSNADRVVDQWIFFKNGVEVYREIDSDFDTKADRSRPSPREGAAVSAAVSRSQTRRPSVRR